MNTNSNFWHHIWLFRYILSRILNEVIKSNSSLGSQRSLFNNIHLPTKIFHNRTDLNTDPLLSAISYSSKPPEEYKKKILTTVVQIMVICSKFRSVVVAGKKYTHNNKELHKHLRQFVAFLSKSVFVMRVSLGCGRRKRYWDTVAATIDPIKKYMSLTIAHFHYKQYREQTQQYN